MEMCSSGYQSRHHNNFVFHKPNQSLSQTDLNLVQGQCPGQVLVSLTIHILCRGSETWRGPGENSY